MKITVPAGVQEKDIQVWELGDFADVLYRIRCAGIWMSSLFHPKYGPEEQILIYLDGRAVLLDFMWRLMLRNMPISYICFSG